MTSVSIIAVTSLPEVVPGDDLIDLLASSKPGFAPGDILIVTQKVVSKAEGRLVRLDEVTPSAKALAIAGRWEKDPRLVELVLNESSEILREERGVLISRTHHGFVCANAGIDLSNVDGGATACLLPVDCDGSAKRLSEGLSERLGFHLPVIISDSFGQPWRVGIINVALGSHGLAPLIDHRGEFDPYGLEMKATVIGIADTLSAATELVVGKTTGFGATIVRGYEYALNDDAGVADTIRPWENCFFI